MTHNVSNIIDLTNAPTPLRWFEFLLEPRRLNQHLETTGCDPSPTQLISLFFRNIPSLETNVNHSPCQRSTNTPASANGNGQSPATGQTGEDVAKVNHEVTDKLLIDYSDSAEVQIPSDSYEANYRAKKAYSLQTLALKIASFLKWDLEVICNKLTIPIQYKLMQALTSVCSSKNCPPEMKKFADVIYWHWFLRSAVSYQISTLQPQSNNTTIIYLSQYQQQQQATEISALSSMGELFSPMNKHLKSCSTELHKYISNFTQTGEQSAKKLKSSAHPFRKAKLIRPTMECFDSRNENFNNWDKSEPIDSKEFIAAACYDLGRFFFFEESYELAEQTFELIKDSIDKFPKSSEYLESSRQLTKGLSANGVPKEDSDKQESTNSPGVISLPMNEKRKQTEKYLFDCMTEFSKSQKKNTEMEVEEGEIEGDDECEEDSDLRYEVQNRDRLPENSAWYLQVPPLPQQQQLLEAAKGDVFMSQGNFKQAMGCFVGTLMLMTDYFQIFSKNYIDEEPYISRMIQCSISLSCFTQAVALCQMTRSLNYTIAFKQLNERVCNDCCDDIYECIWNITLLEYIINLHSKRGEVERRTKVIQLIGQLELNENNPEEILKEAEHVRRGRFFRIMSNKYL